MYVYLKLMFNYGSTPAEPQNLEPLSFAGTKTGLVIIIKSGFDDLIANKNCFMETLSPHH